jgi:hypothetical protein
MYAFADDLYQLCNLGISLVETVPRTLTKEFKRSEWKKYIVNKKTLNKTN